MPGEAETRVKHAWEGGIPRHRPPPPPPPPSLPPPPPTTRDPPGFRGFYSRWSGKSHSTWKTSGKETPLLPPARVPERMARIPPCMWGSY